MHRSAVPVPLAYLSQHKQNRIPISYSYLVYDIIRYADYILPSFICQALFYGVLYSVKPTQVKPGNAIQALCRVSGINTTNVRS